VDPRQNKRYQLKAAVTFSWKNTNGSSDLGEGSTRDISIDGVFVLTGHQLRLGTAVQLEVSLPPLLSLHDTRPRVCLRTNGKVIRTEEQGFAAIADMRFRIMAPETPTLKHSVKRVRRIEQQAYERGAGRPVPHSLV